MQCITLFQIQLYIYTLCTFTQQGQPGENGQPGQKVKISIENTEMLVAYLKILNNVYIKFFTETIKTV